jgi:uncharacterized membrane protein YdbT with pleckstrin-like domain
MGSYVNKNLGPNESLVCEAKLHWILFLKPIFFILLAITLTVLLNKYLGEYGLYGLYVGCGLVMICIFFFLSRLIKRVCTEIALTNNRIIVKNGFIARSARDISLKKVEGIDIKQSIFGRIFNYGSMSVRGTGSGEVWYTRIANPYSFQRALNNILSN